MYLNCYDVINIWFTSFRRRVYSSRPLKTVVVSNLYFGSGVLCDSRIAGVQMWQ